MGAPPKDSRGKQRSGDRGREPRLALLYSAHAVQVRRDLSDWGVRGADLDDLCQEVFLIVADKGEGLADIQRMDLWLREVSRKVAAGYRRQGFRQREVSVEAGAHAIDEGTPLHSAVLESEEDAQRLYQAVNALDDEAKDLIALHELGGLPLVDVATLVARDRKTVRKRLDEANRRLTRLFREYAPASTRFAQLTPHALPAPARGGPSGALLPLVLGSTADVRIGLLGPVLIAVWPGPPTLDALTLLDEQAARAVELCGSGLVYLAIVEASTSTPTLEARKKISSMLKVHSKSFGVCPHVLLGGFSWIARPIMAALTFLSGVPLPMPFFSSVERAATWLCTGYLRENPITHAGLVAAVQHLRQLPESPLLEQVSDRAV